MFKIIELAHLMLKSYIKEGMHIIDATCGNGHDTLFIAECLNNTGTIDAYDIQAEAINNTKKLTLAFNNINFYHTSHAFLNPKNVDVAIFNFGYLPGGDKTITTLCNSSIIALKKLVEEATSHKMLILLVLYPGHAEGKIEAQAIEEYANSLCPKTFLVSTYHNSNQHLSPYLIAISNK